MDYPPQPPPPPPPDRRRRPNAIRAGRSASPRDTRRQRAADGPARSTTNAYPIIAAEDANEERRSAAYAYVNMSAEQREEARVRSLHEKTTEALGSNWFGRERSNATASKLGRWESKLEASREGMTTWELKKHKSRKAFEQMAASPTSGLGAKAISFDSSNLGLMKQASQMGLPGRSYIEINPSVMDKMQSRGNSPAPAENPMSSRDPQHAALMANDTAAGAAALARKELQQLQSGIASPTQNPAPHSTSTGLPYIGSSPNAPPANRPPRAISQSAMDSQGHFSYGNYQTKQSCDVSLDKLGYNDLVKVQNAAALLAQHFPQSQYLRPLFEQAGIQP